jgi:5,10-methylenetetrahydromethanopterin reductase
VEFGLGVQTDKPLEEYARIASRAEELGFDVVCVYADLYYQSPLPALLQMAAATERVRLGVSCYNPFTLHPVEIAGQTAMLDAASNGRAFLGLAHGAWLDTLRLDLAHPLDAIRDTVEIVRRLLRGDTDGYEGRRYSLAPGETLRYDVLRADVPLHIGTWAPRLAAYAGEVAQELKIGGSANPEMVRLMRERIGNDNVGIVSGATTVADEDGERARRVARAEVQMYVDVIGKLDPTSGGDDLDRFAFAGTPDEIARHVERLRDAGAHRVDFGTPHGAPPDRGRELLGEIVRQFA